MSVVELTKNDVRLLLHAIRAVEALAEQMGKRPTTRFERLRAKLEEAS